MAEEFEKVLTFEIERDGDTAVVKCHGRLVSGATEELYGEVKDLLAQTKVLVVDLADLTYVDSTGLGTLVRLHAKGQVLLSVHFFDPEDVNPVIVVVRPVRNKRWIFPISLE